MPSWRPSRPGLLRTGKDEAVEDWIYRIMNARNPNWRTLSTNPAATGTRESRRDYETFRRER